VRAGWLLLAALALAWPAHAEDGERARVRVFAAASLTEVVEALARPFEGGHVVPSFGASSELARQIRDGAPADVFLSASREWVEFLRAASALDGEPLVFARNALVCVAPRGSPLAAQGIADPRALLAHLAPGDRVAIADAGVPAGDYAREALARLGLRDAYRPRLVGQKDVRAVLHAVERGELPAGFVYATDAKLAAVERLFALDPTTHPPVEYQAAALRAAANPAGARAFLLHLRSDAARALLSDAGFALP